MRKRKPVTDQELVETYALGMDGERHVHVYAQTKNFIVYREDGHKYWSAMYQPWAYTPLRHILIRRGDHWWNEKREWAGRVTKAVAKEIQNALEQSEDAGEIVMKKLDKTKLVKEMSRERIGVVPVTKRVPKKRRPGRDKVHDDE